MRLLVCSFLAVAALIIATLAAEDAHADIIARCGASAGQAYYFGGSLAPKGWRSDGIASGRLDLIRDGENSFDIVYTDASGGTRSVRGCGFEIIRISSSAPNHYLLIAVHKVSAVVEHWLFEVDASGRGVVAWGTIRAIAPIPKSSLMTAECVGR